MGRFGPGQEIWTHVHLCSLQAVQHRVIYEIYGRVWQRVGILSPAMELTSICAPYRSVQQSRRSIWDCASDWHCASDWQSVDVTVHRAAAARVRKSFCHITRSSCCRTRVIFVQFSSKYRAPAPPIDRVTRTLTCLKMHWLQCRHLSVFYCISVYFRLFSVFLRAMEVYAMQTKGELNAKIWQLLPRLFFADRVFRRVYNPHTTFCKRIRLIYDLTLPQ